MDLNSSEIFNNREWSWLEFNKRVLFEAKEESNPLLERIKFTAIVTSNLEEFFMVRVAGLIKQKEANFKGSSADSKLPAEQLDGIRKRVESLLIEQYDNFYDELLPRLEKEGITIITELKDIEVYRDVLKSIFVNEIMPVITPISVGPTHPFPNLVTGRLYLAVELVPDLSREDIIEKSSLSFIEIPINTSGRFIGIDKDCFVPLELIIKYFVDDIYNGYSVNNFGVVKFTRDADFSIEEDAAGDLLTEIESKIRLMHHRSIVKIEYEEGFSPELLSVLSEISGTGKQDIYKINGILNLQDLFEIYSKVDRPQLRDEPLKQIHSMKFKNKDIFKMLSEKEILLFHPYDSYSPIIDLINRAAEDEKVLAIKQTLYRTSSDSPIIKALVRAAEMGKYVSVVVELKARFDEKRNINWAKTLEDAGAHVIYGIAGLKTHAKALLIVRKEKKGVKRYIHLATGNYNEITAQMYTDISFFTTEQYYGEDIAQLYNMLTGFSYPSGWNYLTIAPLDLRRKSLELIAREEENAKRGMKAEIKAMMNSLSDKEIAKALYKASMAGVKIKLIVRGICILKPGIDKISHNITVKSIIGKFLQHARIFYFYNGGQEDYYLSSADWMSRNLDRRVELFFPIRNAELKDFLKNMFDIQLKDTVNSWILKENGHYKYVNDKNKRDCFNDIYSYIEKQEKTMLQNLNKKIFT